MTTNINQEYVVIGAGTSGLLIAKKLLAQSASVILIGPEDHREQTHVVGMVGNNEEVERSR